MSDFPPIPKKRLSSAPCWMGGARPPVSSIVPARSGGHLSWAFVGVLAVGVTVPCVLTWLHNYGGLFPPSHAADSVSPRLWNVVDLLLLEGIALIGCGPGAVLLTLVLFHLMRKSRYLERATERDAMVLGAGAGAVMAFLNFPGYLSGVFYNDIDSDVTLVRIAILFAITGATCGAWTAWQAYRARHPERKLFPRFSLGTLICWALAWGVLLTVFMPPI
jgi:hypothetical protein